MKTLFALLAIAPTVAIAAASSFGPFGRDVPPKGFDEVCVELAAGERVRYQFQASGDVDFNIHYHRGNEVFYPVKLAAVRSTDAVFTAPHADGYCLMWERKGEGAVRVQGTVERKDR
jgi:hypothetical protein